ncbi:hypothetical protein [Pedobacter sp. SL55]|uniref:hypothetical protein n=1 Tax=Pedobacter sp. SL55 TaxID=2995161 RepID=UPI00226E47CB|nr:hypothetical protein [Pedobacter sp. SL55]WAC42544.1 hypothetical protein OVA16_09380 [Pedobacter sp. SL55]
MKNKFKLSTLLLLLIANIAVAQKIKFPDSFKADDSLFKGMTIAEIPEDIQTKYGITTNPCLITDVAKTKGALFTAKITGVKAIYFEIWKDPMIKKSDGGYEVAQFATASELENILPQLNNASFYRAILTVQNYLIVIKCVPSENAEQNIDKMIAYFQNKLGAKLFMDRKKEVEVAVTENYVTNLPPPLPPEPKNATQIAIEDLDKRIANDDGLAYMRTKKRAKLAPGNYIATSTYPNFETLSFTIDKDSLLHGYYNYHVADDYSKSPSKESKLTYDNGVLVSETVYKDGKLLGSTNYSASVVKEGNDYLITIKTTTKSSNSSDKEVVTVFRNLKPVSKITATLGVSVIKKDFEKKVLEHYNNKGQLTKLKKPGLIEEYDATGKLTYKDEWIDDNHFVYKNGKLITKEIGVKGQQQYLVTDYDGNGKVTKEFSRGIEDGIAIANPDEYEKDLTEALFEYYKKKAK